jgi:hypothetical protein
VRQNGTAADQLPRLWRKHAHSQFPDRLRGQALAGVDLVTLDADVAACVTACLSSKGALDESQRKILTQSVERLDAVLPLLTTRSESLYFSRLRDLSALILQP